MAREKFVEKIIEAGMLKKKSCGKGFVIEFMPIFSIVEGNFIWQNS